MLYYIHRKSIDLIALAGIYSEERWRILNNRLCFLRVLNDKMATQLGLTGIRFWIFVHLTNYTFMRKIALLVYLL